MRLVNFNRWFASLSLGTKIYLSLFSILVPIFALTVFLQIQSTTPLLEEEVRQLGLSVCRSLSSDILSQNLLAKPDKLEAKLIETTWQQPSIVHLSVLTKEMGPNSKEVMKIIASNIDTETPPESSQYNILNEIPQTSIISDEGNAYWQITYPILNKSRTKTIAFVHAQVSLEIVKHFTGIVSQITGLGAIISIALLLWILSYYLKKTIENERKLRMAESQNIELTNQLHEAQRQTFLNEKLAVMGQLTASFAHEIGTPLNSLSGHLQLLKDEIKTNDSKHRIEIINSQVSRIEGTVKDFLASTHDPSQNKQIVDAKELTQKMIRLVQPRLQIAKIQVHLNERGGIKPIRIVPTDLEQVLINLTNNAIDSLIESTHSEKRLIYHIAMTREGSRQLLQLIVEDNGTGIAKGELKNVTKAFYTTKAPGKGTGLGLAICQRLIKKYGGKLELESVLGKGTEVKVKIPYESA